MATAEMTCQQRTHAVIQEDGKEVVIQQYSHCSPASSSRKSNCNYDSRNDGTKTRGSNLAKELQRVIKNNSKQDSEAEDPPVVTVDT